MVGSNVEKSLFLKELYVTTIVGEGPTAPINIGSTGTSHTLVSSSDLYINGKLEVDGISFFDANAAFYGTIQLPGAANKYLYGTETSGSILPNNSSQTVNCMNINTGTTSNTLLICEHDDRAYDFAHTQQTNPTIYLHSANQSATEWISITHDQTDGVIDCGTGTLNLGATGNVNFAGATKTGTGDTATDGYVTMEVAGASVKFATVA